MIGNICLLLEGLSMVICLHYLYGEKFKLGIINASYLTVYMIVLTSINYYDLPKFYTISIYPITVLYCGIRFGFKWKDVIINNILYMALIGGIQLIIAIFYSWVTDFLALDIINLKNNELFIVNGGVLLVVVFVLPKMKLNKLSLYLRKKEGILVISILFCLFLTMFSFTNYKIFNGLKVFQYSLIFISLSLFFILAGQLSKYKIKAKEVETELKMHKLFADSFGSLIDDIRLRQHEFDNHISTIYSLHYTCNSYDELVRAQNEYSQMIIKENRFNKLLKAGNPLLIGFLYGKFMELERIEIEISYQISIGELNLDIPVYKLVEILGNLIKNATEAVIRYENNKAIYVGIIEIDGSFEMEVRNRSEFIEYKEIESFFKKGYSKKGRNRGLGLYNVKNICEEYLLSIFCENRKIDNENWLCFTITNQRRNHLR